MGEAGRGGEGGGEKMWWYSYILYVGGGRGFGGLGSRLGVYCKVSKIKQNFADGGFEEFSVLEAGERRFKDVVLFELLQRS